MPKHEAGSKKSGRVPRQAALKKSPPAANTRVGIRGNSFPPAGEERAFLQAVEDSIISGIIAFDLQGRQTYANPAFCRMVGWSSEDLLEKEGDNLFAPANDLLEDWSLMRWIDEEFRLQQENYAQFFEILGDNLAVRRAFRWWLIDQLSEAAISEWLLRLLKLTVSPNSIPAFWRDIFIYYHSQDMIISMQYCIEFRKRLRKHTYMKKRREDYEKNYFCGG